MPKVEFTDQMERFCQEYLHDFNGTQAAIRAGYSENSAHVTASRLLRKPVIKAAIEENKKKLAEIAGVSKLAAIKELKKYAFSNVEDIFTDWMTRKDFETLPRDVKACIQEIDTKVITKNIGSKDAPEIVDVEHIRVKFVDKRAAMQDLAKLLGWNEPEKHDVNSTQYHASAELTSEQIDRLIDKL